MNTRELGLDSKSNPEGKSQCRLGARGLPGKMLEIFGGIKARYGNERTLADAATSPNNNFNFLRLILAAAVIYAHAPVLLNKTLDPLSVVLGNQAINNARAFGFGTLAVASFFVLSGFLISMSWHRSSSLWNYLKRRVLRIYPAFLMAMLLCFVVFGPLGATDLKGYWSATRSGIPEWVGRTLLLQPPKWDRPPFDRTFADSPFPAVVNGSMWTIRYEFICYVGVAALGISAKFARGLVPRKVMHLIPALLFLSIYLIYAVVSYAPIRAYFQDREGSDIRRILLGDSPWLFTYFMAGMCLYAYRRKISLNFALMASSLIALGVSAFIPQVLVLTLPLFGAYLLLYSAYADWGAASNFGRKQDLSYGAYLYAFPLQQLAVLYFGPHLTPATEFLLVLPPTFLLAWLSWHSVEKPALALK